MCVCVLCVCVCVCVCVCRAFAKTLEQARGDECHVDLFICDLVIRVASYVIPNHAVMGTRQTWNR